ncbi:MAG: ATP-grasp domain-containing protein [Deltaproteobacteria bacterium]|nr:ATP-grasp domain-containing protein [Deltaproteobacteria bacterium]
MSRPLILLVPKTSYREADLLAAAERLGVPTVLASDRCHVLAEDWPAGAIPLDFTQPVEAARALADSVRAREPLAVMGVDEVTSVIAAHTARELHLPHNPIDAVETARDKGRFRAALERAGLPRPWSRLAPRELPADELKALALTLAFPCVLKPLTLSGSRGVIRADDPASFTRAFERVGRLLRSPAVAARRDPRHTDVLIEEFLPGAEVALEGLLHDGALQVLALFDKPDPLDGPFFEETLYVTPSRHPLALQQAIAQATQAAVQALGLLDGPVHAELRLTPRGPIVIELAARSIGGLCGRTLRFGLGVTLEELVLRHALGRTRPAASPSAPEPLLRDQTASGVLMLPIRKGGILREVRGLEPARAVPHIEDIVITAHLDEELVPLPEGASYLGFAFARASTPAEVERALRQAWSQLEVHVTPKLDLAAPR